MTFKEFQTDLMEFLQKSNVNLGRKHTKSKERFLKAVSDKFDSYGEGLIVAEICDDNVDREKKPNSLRDGVIRIKPEDPRKALDAGKGVCAMNATESSRADEQLGRSPYAQQGDKGESVDV
jgi:hypothetical protein